MHCRGALAAAPTTREGHRTEGSQGRCHIPCRLRRGRIPRRAPRWAQSALLATSRGDRTLPCKQLQCRFTLGVVADMNLPLCNPPMPMEDHHRLLHAWHHRRALEEMATRSRRMSAGRWQTENSFRARQRSSTGHQGEYRDGRALPPPEKLASVKTFRPKSSVARVCGHIRRL